MWKVIPRKLMTLKGEFTVIRVEALPPEQHKSSPIVNDMTCVVCHLSNGEKRYFGTEKALIGPDLHMHIIINPQDEVLRTWETSKFFK